MLEQEMQRVRQMLAFHPSLAAPSDPVTSALERDSGGKRPSSDDDNDSVSWCSSTVPPTVEESLEQMVYTWNKSAWDATLFLGHGIFLTNGTVAMAFGVLFNLLLQLSFCYVLFFEDAIVGWDAWEHRIEGAEQWRVRYGHSVQFMDTVTDESLVSKVCSHDDSLFMSTVIGKMVSDITAYNSKGEGRLLTLCVVVLFSLTVCRELRGIVYFIAGLWDLPRGERTTFKLKDGKTILECISRPRFFAGCTISVVRTVISLTLLYVGSIWLVNTVNLESLLLNAVALAFIFDTDEVVYDAFAPHRMDNLLENLQPVPCTSHVYFRHLLRPLKTLIVLLTASWFTFGALGDVVNNQEKLRATLCDGNKDFVFSVGADGTFAYTLTRPHDTFSGALQDMITARLEMIRTVNSTNRSELKGGARLLETTRENFHRTISELSTARTTCLDDDYNFSSTALLTTGNRSVKCCKDAEQYCSYWRSYGTRLHCPQTCGCASPTSGLVLRRHRDGCPAVCPQSLEYRSILEDIPCRDTPLEELRNSTGWRRLFDGFRHKVEELYFMGNESRAVRWFTDEKLAELDCPKMLRSLSWSFRKHSGFPLTSVCREGLVGFCPESCWCANATAQREWREHWYGPASDMFENLCPPSCKDRLA